MCYCYEIWILPSNFFFFFHFGGIFTVTYWIKIFGYWFRFFLRKGQFGLFLINFKISKYKPGLLVLNWFFWIKKFKISRLLKIWMRGSVFYKTYGQNSMLMEWSGIKMEQGQFGQSVILMFTVALYQFWSKNKLFELLKNNEFIYNFVKTMIFL